MRIVVGQRDIQVLRLVAESKVYSYACGWRTFDAYEVTRWVDRLQSAGLVEATDSPSAGVKIVAVPTDRGYRLINDEKTSDIMREIRGY